MSADRDASGEPGGVDVGLVVDEVRAGAPSARRPRRAGREFDEVSRADDEHEVGRRARPPARACWRFGGRVADVVRARARAAPGSARAASSTISFVSSTASVVWVRNATLLRIGDLERARHRRRPRRAGSTPAPRPSCPRPPRGRRDRRGRSSCPRSAKRRASACTLLDERARRVDHVEPARRRASRCTAGETPCAEKTTVAPSGTSSSSSTKTAPRRSSSATTCSLWTICLRT